MTKINLDKHKLLLSQHRIPFTALNVEAFELEEYLQDIEHYDDEKKPPLLKSRSEQAKFYKACLDVDAGKGWTACFSSDVDIGRPEAAAAQVMAAYSAHQPNCVWVNITDSKWYGDKQIREIANPTPINPTGMIIVSGLRWQSDSVRFDKALDVLREAPPNASRIIVGVGATPIAFIRHIGITASRVLYFRNHKVVDL